jgi:hypothetical protein
MHAVLVHVTIDDFETGSQILKSEIVPRVAQAPGFVAGYWVHTGREKGHGMIVFESEEAAQAVKAMVESGPSADAEAVSLDSVEVAEVVASA